MSNHAALGAQFRRLAPEVQFTLAKRLGLTDPQETSTIDGRENVWLLRAHFRNKLDDLGTAIRADVYKRQALPCRAQR